MDERPLKRKRTDDNVPTSEPLPQPEEDTKPKYFEPAGAGKIFCTHACVHVYPAIKVGIPTYTGVCLLCHCFGFLEHNQDEDGNLNFRFLANKQSDGEVVSWKVIYGPSALPSVVDLINRSGVNDSSSSSSSSGRLPED
jgi:hypothetical protein